MSVPNNVVVVPTISEQYLRDFLVGWRDDLGRAQIIVVEDRPAKTFSTSDIANVTH